MITQSLGHLPPNLPTPAPVPVEPTTQTPNTEPEMCDCDCEYMEKISYFSNSSNNYENKSQEELIEILQEKLNQVKGQLKVEKAEIPAMKARKVSAPDSLSLIHI